MPALPDIAGAQCGVFAVSQTDPAEWTRAALRHALRIGRIRRVRRGVYQASDLSEVRDGIDKWSAPGGGTLRPP